MAQDRKKLWMSPFIIFMILLSLLGCKEAKAADLAGSSRPQRPNSSLHDH
jgi:hypothetical protein